MSVRIQVELKILLHHRNSARAEVDFRFFCFLKLRISIVFTIVDLLKKTEQIGACVPTFSIIIHVIGLNIIFKIG
jgi:hypothetical protein